MASVPVSHVSLFIVILVTATSVTAVLSTEVSRVNGILDEYSLDLRQDVRTDVEIVGEAGTDIYDPATTNATLYVRNAGAERLPATTETIVVLVDGSAPSRVGVTVVDGAWWDPGSVVRLDVETGPLEGDDHTATVVVNGDREVLDL